ncbi:MAG: hypothetical protein WKG00_03155 [Polyangiaceae bacterium]
MPAPATLPPPSAPLVRGKRLRSTVRRAGAILATDIVRTAMREQNVSQQFLAAVLEVDQSWVHDVVTGRSAVLLGDILKAPKSLRRAVALQILLSAESDNSHR